MSGTVKIQGPGDQAFHGNDTRLICGNFLLRLGDRRSTFDGKGFGLFHRIWIKVEALPLLPASYEGLIRYAV